jgi:RNA-dependent RNA polymerase
LTGSHRQELDREQKAIKEDFGRGVGLMGDWEGVEKWYGGRVQQVARLELAHSEGPPTDPKRRQFEIRLEKLESGRSYKIARVLGSRRMLQVRVSKDLKGEDVVEYLKHDFVICGRVFRAFHTKEHTVYMVETDDTTFRRSNHDQGDQHRIGFNEFIEGFNPLMLNYDQVSVVGLSPFIIISSLPFVAHNEMVGTLGLGTFYLNSRN